MLRFQQASKLVCICIAFLTLLAAVQGHDGIDHLTEEEAFLHEQSVGGGSIGDQIQGMLPFMYFNQGQYFIGIMLIIMWTAIVHGIKTLGIMVLSRL